MTAQEGDMDFTLECFAEEAADTIALLWNERTGEALSARQKNGLVEGIWECVLPKERAEPKREARILMHST